MRKSDLDRAVFLKNELEKINHQIKQIQNIQHVTDVFFIIEAYQTNIGTLESIQVPLKNKPLFYKNILALLQENKDLIYMELTELLTKGE